LSGLLGKIFTLGGWHVREKSWAVAAVPDKLLRDLRLARRFCLLVAMAGCPASTPSPREGLKRVFARRRARADCPSKFRTQMKLPNYFLADVHPGSHITPLMLRKVPNAEAHRGRYLRNAHGIAYSQLSGWRRTGCRRDYPSANWRSNKAERDGLFPPQPLARGLDAFFREVTPRTSAAGNTGTRPRAAPGQFQRHAGRRALRNAPRCQRAGIHGSFRRRRTAQPGVMSIILGCWCARHQFVNAPAALRSCRACRGISAL